MQQQTHMEFIESNRLDKLFLRQYIGCDIAHVGPKLLIKEILAYLFSQSLIIFDATIEATAITVICGLTPTEVGNTPCMSHQIQNTYISEHYDKILAVLYQIIRILL